MTLCNLPGRPMASRRFPRMKKPRPAPTFPEIAAEGIAAAILFWLIKANLALHNESALAIGLVAWFGARCLIEIPKGIWQLYLTASSGLRRLVRPSPH